MKIGELLKAARLDAGITLREAFKETGIGTTVLSDIELGVVEPSNEQVFHLALFYGLTKGMEVERCIIL